MDTVGELLDRERRSGEPALVEWRGRRSAEDATSRTYDYHWLCTSAWKAGNFLRHAGVRRNVTVGVVGDGPLALLAFFGTALLEGATRFDPPRSLRSATDLRALVAPVGDLDVYELPRGAQRVGYGGEPDDPAVHRFDAGLWSENPSFPPIETDPGTTLLTDGEQTWSHADALAAARSIADDVEMDSGTRVAVAAPLSDPRVVVTGVIAPLLVGGVVVLSGETEEGGTSGSDGVDVAVGADGSSAGKHIDPADVDFPSSESP